MAPDRAAVSVSIGRRLWQRGCVTTSEASDGAVEGRFWLAGAPETTALGKLDMDACLLDLSTEVVAAYAHAPVNDTTTSIQEIDDAEVRYRLHGVLEDGRAVTLPQALRHPSDWSGSQHFSDLRILVGWPEGDPKDAPVEQLTLTYGPEMAGWLRQSGGIELETPLTNAPELRVAVNHDGEIIVSRIPGWTLHQCTDRLHMPLSGLLAVLTHRAPTRPWRLGYVTGDISVTVLRRVSEQSLETPIRECVSRLHYEDAASWVRGWLDVAATLSPSYLTAVQNFTQPPTVQHQIFALASALERFHSKVLPKLDKMPDEQRRQLAKQASEAVPDEQSDRVEGILLNYLAQPSLARRLFAITDYLPQTLAADLCGASGGKTSPRQIWVSAVKDARNATGHATGMDELVDFDLYVARLAALSESLVFVVSAVYLLAAGMAPNRVERGLRDLSHFHLMRGRLRSRWPELYDVATPEVGA